jgi:glycerophosphoryl diester phosphodiesterase
MAGYAAAFSEAGVDAVFTDFPALARSGRSANPWSN